jgi:hypothetical protein
MSKNTNTVGNPALAIIRLKTWAALFFPVLFSAATAGTFPDYGYQPPADWDMAKFTLRQDYPQTKPPTENYPWLTIDFKTQPEAYLQAVLKYSFEGNVDVDFVPQNNSIRKWYHAPWLHYGNNGREFVHGLTRERSSRPFELSPTQTQTYRNFAVGLYNDQGGYTIGQVWHNPTAPNVMDVQFPEGTVSFKLLFTTAPATLAPFLAGAPEWIADIDHSQDINAIKTNKVRLLQIDVAVKDSRSSCGGWIFGTFHYDASLPGNSPWEKLRPLTLLWGNDPKLTETMFNNGQLPAQTWIDATSPIALFRQNPPAGIKPPKVFGWAGRGNGPVDNSLSSCLSCHSTAQIPATSPMIPPITNSEPQKLHWFRNLAVTEPFDATSQTLDFSLQLGVGIQNFQSFKTTVETMIASMGGVFNTQQKIFSSGFTNEPPNKGTKKPRKEYHFSRDPEE